MKKLCLALVVIIVASTLVGFKSVDKELMMLEWALANVKKHASVEMVSIGSSEGTIAGLVDIASTVLINFENGEATEYYRLSLSRSNATGIFGNIANDIATRAKRTYYKAGTDSVYTQKRAHRTAVGEMPNLVPDFANTTVDSQLRAEYENDLQRGVFDFFFYNVNKQTISKVVKKLEFNKADRTWSFAFELNSDAAALSKIEIMQSGGLAQVEYKSLVLTFTIDEGGRLVRVVSEGAYCAKLKGLAKLAGTQHTQITTTTTFKYNDTPREMPWSTKNIC